MTASNSLRFTGVRQTTLGTTPGTPRMRAMNVTSADLQGTPQFVNSDTLRDDRMQSDPIKVGEEFGGSIGFEFQYPPPDSLMSTVLESLFFRDRLRTPERDNDGVADSAITDVIAASQTVNVAIGAAFVVNHLVRHTGFAPAQNNGLFRVTTGGATSYIALGAGLVNEAAPAANARVKVVGFQAPTAGDVQAVAGGLQSTALNFTTFGLVPGQWINIGGAAAPFRFAGTPANNSWARVSGTPTATFLPLDNLPTGWAADAAGGVTLRVFFGDRLVNGTTFVGATFERGFMRQVAPTYLVNESMVANQGTFSLQRKRPVTCQVSFLGMSGRDGTVSLDAAPDPAPNFADYPVFAGSANVARVSEGGQVLGSGNGAGEVSITINNNLAGIETISSMGLEGIRDGESTVTANLMAYFGSRAILSKVLAGTASSLAVPMRRGTVGAVFDLPRVTYTAVGVPVQGKNQDVMQNLSAVASADPLTGYQIALHLFEYVEA